MAETVVQPNNKLSAPNRKVASMAKLTTEDRKELPKSDFAGPGRSYPIPPGDRAHAGNAKARASQMHKRGLISDKELSKINGKADKVLGSSKSKASGDTEADGSSDTAEKDDPPAVKPRGSDQVDVKVKPGSAGWAT